jgi:nucleoside-diphosphate-sugar epimerase
MHILVAGAGYIGLPLAQKLRGRGHDVTGWIRSFESAEKLRSLGIFAIQADIAKEKNWRQHRAPWDVIFYCASSSRGNMETYEMIHRWGLRYALESKAKQFIYCSSTSVYGQLEGEWVEETSPAEPPALTSRILRLAEQDILKQGGVVARLSGIYGPERAVYLRRFLRGDPAPDPDRWVNQIHRDDAVEALYFLIGQRGVFNVSDDEPVRLSALWSWFCQLKGEVKTRSAAFIPTSAKRAWTNKRVSNAKLKSLGFRFQYPTFKEGYSVLE